MARTVYLNGRLVPRSQARISALDYGFLYGYGLFETMRAYRGRVFRLERHLDRLARSAQVLGMTVDTRALEAGVVETMRANGLSDARVRIAVSIGQGRMPPDPATCHKPTVLILVDELHQYPDEMYRKGFRAVVSTIRRNSQSPLSRIKSANYLESMLVRQEARQAGADEAICLNEKGLLAEASMSNIFLVTGEALTTPGLGSGILPGITREAVLELAPQSGIKALEQDIKLEELFQSEEAFLTNSLIEVVPLVEVGGKPIGSGEPGPVTRKLMTAYRELVLAESREVKS